MTTRGPSHHPWRRLLRHHPNITVHFRPLPDGLLGYTDVAAGRIVLDSELTQAERRSVLAHELEHVERNGVVADHYLRDREELIVDRIAARKLVGLRHLIDALLWSQHPHEVADDLWVDVATLRARLADLTDDERATISNALQEADTWTA
jgi:hypothetical protein